MRFKKKCIKNQLSTTMDRLQRVLLTASIHLANIYSFHNLITKLVLWRLNGFYSNIAVFLLSVTISMIIVGLVDFVLKNNKLSFLGYSLVRFFVATYVSVTLVFLTAFTLVVQEGAEFTPFQNETARFLFYPFLLYTGFFFNLTCSRFALASKEEYLKNNPKMTTRAIIATKIITFTIFVLSFLPICVIGVEYALALLN